MRKLGLLTIIILLAACGHSLISRQQAAYPPGLQTFEDSLYFIYSQPSHRWPEPNVDTSVRWSELSSLPPSPLANPSLQQKEIIALGKALFFDKRLSGNAKLSCASCHLPELSWTDGRQKSLGHEDQLTKRNSPTLLNVWYYTSFFWDGRSNSLEDQAFSPINSSREMHSSMGDVVGSLHRIEGYKPMFTNAFGSGDISPETITQAIAVFERTLVSAPAAFDKFLNGTKTALSPSAIRGLHLFRTKAGCMNCHYGPLLTDNLFHNTGLADVGSTAEDLGRYIVTHKDEDAGKFKTPSLRDVMRTGPWMHNGLHKNMNDIIESYGSGRRLTTSTPSNPLLQQPDKLLKPLALTPGEITDIASFLEAITAAPPVVTLPNIP